MSAQLKRGHIFKENEPIDAKFLNDELTRIEKFINTNVEIKENPNLETYNERVVRKKRSLGEPLDDDTPIHGGNKPRGGGGKPKYPEANIIGGSHIAKIAGEEVYRTINISAIITKDNIGSDVVIGAVPTGHTIRRWYSRVLEAFDNANNEIEAKDFDGNILIYKDQIDLLTLDSLNDAPMDHLYNNSKDITAKIYGSASAKGRVRITFELVKVFEQQILT